MKAKKKRKNKSKELIPFVNYKGKVISFPGDMTLAQAYRAGVRKITLEPAGTPLPKNPLIYTHNPMKHP